MVSIWNPCRNHSEPKDAIWSRYRPHGNYHRDRYPIGCHPIAIVIPLAAIALDPCPRSQTTKIAQQRLRSKACTTSCQIKRHGSANQPPSHSQGTLHACVCLLSNSSVFCRMVGWSDGRMVGWSDDRMVGWSDGRMVGWSDGRVDRRMVG